MADAISSAIRSTGITRAAVGGRATSVARADNTSAIQRRTNVPANPAGGHAGEDPTPASGSKGAVTPSVGDGSERFSQSPGGNQPMAAASPQSSLAPVIPQEKKDDALMMALLMKMLGDKKDGIDKAKVENPNTPIKKEDYDKLGTNVKGEIEKLSKDFAEKSKDMLKQIKDFKEADKNQPFIKDNKNKPIMDSLDALQKAANENMHPTNKDGSFNDKFSPAKFADEAKKFSDLVDKLPDIDQKTELQAISKKANELADNYAKPMMKLMEGNPDTLLATGTKLNEFAQEGFKEIAGNDKFKSAETGSPQQTFYGSASKLDAAQETKDPKKIEEAQKAFDESYKTIAESKDTTKVTAEDQAFAKKTYTKITEGTKLAQEAQDVARKGGFADEAQGKPFVGKVDKALKEMGLNDNQRQGFYSGLNVDVMQAGAQAAKNAEAEAAKAKATDPAKPAPPTGAKPAEGATDKPVAKPPEGTSGSTTPETPKRSDTAPQAMNLETEAAPSPTPSKTTDGMSAKAPSDSVSFGDDEPETKSKTEEYAKADDIDIPEPEVEVDVDLDLDYA